MKNPEKRQTYLISFVGTDKKGITTFGNDIVWLDGTIKATDIPEVKSAIAFKQGLIAVSIINALPVRS